LLRHVSATSLPSHRQPSADYSNQFSFSNLSLMSYSVYSYCMLSLCCDALTGLLKLLQKYCTD